MYFALEPALQRIFGTLEHMIKSASWQQDINSGYRRSRVPPGQRRTKDERIGDDGVSNRHLRENMTPALYSILIIRYDDNDNNRKQHWAKVNHQFRTDERIPKDIRTNPVMLQLFLMYLIQYPELRQGKVVLVNNDVSRMTVYRWSLKCEQVCGEWIKAAEDQAQDVLEKAGVIK
ncbi:hypothetical protein [Endozoicomonas sp.]|uniref:hypothetical protein n=1 Tax=Endozoicomonas sp. TaxID=1892382 RepID=UPI00383B18F3